MQEKVDPLLATEVLFDILDCTCTVGGLGDAYLVEADPESSIKELKLTGLVKGDLLIPVDQCRNRKCLECDHVTSRVVAHLKEVKAVKANRLADYVLLTRNENKFDCIYVEIKSTSSAGASDQFKSTQCLMGYFVSVLGKLHGSKLEINREIFAVVQPGNYGLKFRKPPAKTKGDLESTPTNPLRISRKDLGQLSVSELLNRKN